MFCFQCNQELEKDICDGEMGSCGKTKEIAAMQDYLLFLIKKISRYLVKLKNYGYENKSANCHIIEAICATSTNLNFDEDKLMEIITNSKKILNEVIINYIDICDIISIDPKIDQDVDISTSIEKTEIIKQANQLSINHRIKELGQDISSLQELLTYNIKGFAYYTNQVIKMGYGNNDIFDFINKAMGYMGDNNHPQKIGELYELNIEAGKIAYLAYELQNMVYSDLFGEVEEKEISTGYKQGKCILVTGDNLISLHKILEETKDSNINIYTYGDMIYAHSYPELAKYPNLIGHLNYDNKNTKDDFANFPGAIILTSDANIREIDISQDNIFTYGEIYIKNVKRISNNDFKVVLKKSKYMKGFAEKHIKKIYKYDNLRKILIQYSDKISNGVNSGKIKKFVFINHIKNVSQGFYKDLINSIDEDCIILNIGCSLTIDKNIDIDGIPRIINIGQSPHLVLRFIKYLAEILDCRVHELPITFALSWYDQKTISVFMSLLNLGVKRILIGPKIPKFISSNVLSMLVDNFEILPMVNNKKLINSI